MSRHDFVGTTTVIDLVQALELLQICADEMAGDADDERSLAPAADKRMSLAARALAKRQLDVTQLSRLDLGDDPYGTRRAARADYDTRRLRRVPNSLQTRAGRRVDGAHT